MITRTIESELKKQLLPGKVLVLYGPRRVGKTTLINKLASELGREAVLLRGEERLVRETFSSNESARMRGLVGDAKYVLLDEAQKIPKIGENLKLFVDTWPEVAVLASGSSSFDLSREVGEPLTGRQNILTLYPFSQGELVADWGRAKTAGALEDVLIYGSYPETVNLTSHESKQEYLKTLTQSYLYKDILEFENVRNSEKIFSLLSLVAYQIGREVSLTELAGNLQITRKTVVKYLDLLEKSFVLINIRGFSRNLRSEVTKTSRYYFWDNGVRNAVISNFNPLSRRNDRGELWENFLAVERIKKQNYQKIYANNYFWRTYEQQEIDWVEERAGELCGFEFKWNSAKVKRPALWTKAYPTASYLVVSSTNYWDFVL